MFYEPALAPMAIFKDLEQFIAHFSPLDNGEPIHADRHPMLIVESLYLPRSWRGVVVMLGAYTRLGNAGLGCPDWPGCYGSMTVPESPMALAQAKKAFPKQAVEPVKAWKEMTHRYVAGVLATTIFILAIWALVRRRHNHEQPVLVPLMLLGLIVFQALLGMWTVTWKVQPLVVSAHLLGTGMATVALLWYLTLRSRSHLLSSFGYYFEKHGTDCG